MLIVISLSRRPVFPSYPLYFTPVLAESRNGRRVHRALDLLARYPLGPTKGSLMRPHHSHPILLTHLLSIHFSPLEFASRARPLNVLWLTIVPPSTTPCCLLLHHRHLLLDVYPRLSSPWLELRRKARAAVTRIVPPSLPSSPAIPTCPSVAKLSPRLLARPPLR